MSVNETKPPSYFEVIQSLLRPLQEPISLESLVNQVLAVRPSTARNPRRAILNQIRQAEGHLLIRPDPGTVMPLRLAFQGVRFRIRLYRETVNSGQLEIETPLRSYLPRNFPLERLVFVEASGRPIPFDLVSVANKVETIFGLSELTHWHAKLSGWFRSQKAYHKDHLLLTLLDWEQGIFRLELEPALAHRFDLIKERNRQLADRFYDQLEQASRDMLFVHVAVPTAYARLQDKGGYPPDHWLVAIQEDGRITSDEFGIHYSDGLISPLEAMLRQAAGERLSAPPKKFSRGKTE